MADGGTHHSGSACPECRAAVAPGTKFCAECGHRLVPAAPTPTPTPTPSAERRQLSVMFCDLVGSTTLSGSLDPEDLRDLLREYHEAATRAIRDFDGYVAEYLGDGLVVYFGYPQAHEDDAERACRAGVRIIENMASLNELLEPRLGLRLGVRIGVHTGLVVVGEVGAHDVRDVVRVVGETPNIAARVQGEAPEDGVMITAETRALAGARIDAHPAGARTLKGVAEPVEVFEVRGVFDAPATRPPSTVPIVDRVEAQAHLRTVWSTVVREPTQGRAVVLAGQAGIGKSKLLDALRDVVEADDGRWFEAACSPYHETSALQPLAALLRRHAEPLGGDDDDDDDEARALLAPLLGLVPTAPSRQLGVAPAVVRRATNLAILRALRTIAGPRPTVLAIEDTHWADASTREFVDLVHAEPQPGLLLVTTDREPSEHGPLVVDLQPLEPGDAATLVELTAGTTLSASLRDELAARTDGVPLFATELVRTLLESGAMETGTGGLELRASVDRDTIPVRLQDSLMARIDRLGAAKPIAQLAATIGRTFRYDVLAAVADRSAEELDAALAQLVDAHVVSREDERFVFAHALLRDVAYGSMLRATRRTHHGRIADALTELFPDMAASEPALVAHHLAEAGDATRAHAWWRQAAQQANQRSASADALAALRRAVDLLPAIPASPEKVRDELATHAALGSALAAVKGYGDDETAAAYERAHELAAEVPAAPELFPVLFGLVAYSTARGDFTTARTAADQLLESAEASGDDGLRIEAQFSLGILDVYLAHFEDAIERLSDGIALYDPDLHHQLAFSYVFDPGVACLRSIGIPLAMLGRHDEARRSADEAIVLSLRLDHAFSHASALVFSAVIAALQGDHDCAATDAQTAIDIADGAGYPFWSLSGRILRGWALGRPDDVRTATEAYRSTGSKVLLPLWLTLLADAERRTGDPAAADEAFAAAEAIAAETGERCWDGLRTLLVPAPS